MTKGLRKIITKADRLPKKGAGAFEWVTFAAAVLIGYIFFCHQDVLITAGHAVEYLNGHITDFYSACKDTDGAYCANYLPSTFILFAVWNIPMKLFGLTPEMFGDWNIPFMMWNKLLPTAAYFISGVLIYKLCRDRFDFSSKKASLTMLLAFTAPMAFFTQFFFCQYDIFTVLFMLLGMYFYFKKQPSTKDYVLFSLFFGIATTFKYFALLIFIVLLLLRVKDILDDILLAVLSLIPAGAEVLFYLICDRKAFVKSVFDFSALDYAGGFCIDLGDVSVNLMYVFLIALIAFSYFTKADSFDELAGYGMFYSCGVCFALFGMMLWHPQWALFAVPFLVLGTVLNKNHKVLLWVDALMGVVFLVYIVNQFQFTLENQGLMRYGILMDSLRYKVAPTLRMNDLFIFKDADTLYSILSGAFFVSFIFRHPKFNFDKINSEISDGRIALNVRFLAFVLAFLTASFITLPTFKDSGDLLWRSYGDSEQIQVTISDKEFAYEYTSLEKMEIESVYAVCDTIEKSEEKATICVDILEAETGKTVAHGEGQEKNIKNGSQKYTKLQLDEPFATDGGDYIFKFYTDSQRQVYIMCENADFTDVSLLRTMQKDYSSSYAFYDGKADKNSNVVMKLTGNAV